MAREKGMGNLQHEKSGRWTMRVTIVGKHYARSTRTTDKAKAERALQRFLAPFGLGEHRLPLAEVWNAYVISPNRNDLAQATLASKRSVWMNFAKWMEHNHLEVGDLAGVTPEAIAEYLAFLRSDVCASTYNNRVCVLREIFRVLAVKAGLEEDPWEGVKLRVDDSHSRRELTVEELGRLLKAAREYKPQATSSHAELRPIQNVVAPSRFASRDILESVAVPSEWEVLFLVGIYTGLRLGDCCRLEWSAVDLKNGVIQLVPKKVKRHRHGRPVTIPIHPELGKALVQRRRGIPAACNESESRDKNVASPLVASPFVLPELAEAYVSHKWTVTNGVAKIFKAANITMSVKLEGRRTKTPEATFHSLRHTFVSLAANAGVPLHIVQSIVGHESTAMTRHYYHENVEALRAAVAAIPALGAGMEVEVEGGGGQRRRGILAACQESESRDRNVASPSFITQHSSFNTLSPEMMGELWKMYDVLKGVFEGNDASVATRTGGGTVDGALGLTPEMMGIWYNTHTTENLT